MRYFEDHGLPIVQLKERRRELVVALIGCSDPIADGQVAQIAALQQAIMAIEAVMADLDSEMVAAPPPGYQPRRVAMSVP